MSARPKWLSDEMLAEMRRLKGTDDQNFKPWTQDMEEMLILTRGDAGEGWVNGFNQPPGPGIGWLTEAGHEALAALEAEEQTAGTPIDRSGLAVETRRAYHEDAVFHHAVDSIVGAVSCGQMAPELARQVSDAVGWILDKRRPSTSTEGGGS